MAKETMNEIHNEKSKGQQVYRKLDLQDINLRTRIIRSRFKRKRIEILRAISS